MGKTLWVTVECGWSLEGLLDAYWLPSFHQSYRHQCGYAWMNNGLNVTRWDFLERLSMCVWIQKVHISVISTSESSKGHLWCHQGYQCNPRLAVLPSPPKSVADLCIYLFLISKPEAKTEHCLSLMCFLFLGRFFALFFFFKSINPLVSKNIYICAAWSLSGNDLRQHYFPQPSAEVAAYTRRAEINRLPWKITFGT